MGFIKEIAFLVRKYAPFYDIKVCSPIIAQAVLESASGTSELAKNACNYFGLKYKSNVAADHYIKVGSEQNPDGSYTSSVMKWCKFPSMESGVKGYFDFISADRYKALKGITDPLEYLQKIKAAGYATSHKYVENLMAVIEKYNLTEFDKDIGGVEMAHKVFLSAGHGGSDPGAVANGLKEKDINLNTLLACRDVLEAHGVEVITSRVTDENDSVQEEVKEANASGAEIAVSFHANAGGGDGFEAFYYSTSQKGKSLAQKIEKHVVQTGQNSRGLKTGDHLHFINGTKMTAVLAESFFVDNAKDKETGDTVEKQRNLGIAYAKGILEYLGIAYSNGAATDPEEKEKLYRVQVGAYKIKSNAEAALQRLKNAGFNGFITES